MSINRVKFHLPDDRIKSQFQTNFSLRNYLDRIESDPQVFIKNSPLAKLYAL